MFINLEANLVQPDCRMKPGRRFVCLPQDVNLVFGDCATEGINIPNRVSCHFPDGVTFGRWVLALSINRPTSGWVRSRAEQLHGLVFRSRCERDERDAGVVGPCGHPFRTRLPSDTGLRTPGKPAPHPLTARSMSSCAWRGAIAASIQLVEGPTTRSAATARRSRPASPSAPSLVASGLRRSAARRHVLHTRRVELLNLLTVF
jgi:hypothetical protein